MLRTTKVSTGVNASSLTLQGHDFGTVTKPVGQLKFNGFKVVGDIFLKVQVTDDPPR